MRVGECICENVLGAEPRSPCLQYLLAYTCLNAATTYHRLGPRLDREQRRSICRAGHEGRGARGCASTYWALNAAIAHGAIDRLRRPGWGNAEIGHISDRSTGFSSRGMHPYEPHPKQVRAELIAMAIYSFAFTPPSPLRPQLSRQDPQS